MVAQSQKLTVQTFSWQIEDKETANGCVNIFAWAHGVDSEPYLLRIEDFPHSCYIELPKNVGNRMFNWNKLKATEFGEFLRQRMMNEGHGIAAYQYVEKYKLYYFQPDKTNLLQVTFKNRDDMNYFLNKIKYPIYYDDRSYVLKAWEENASIIRKLLSATHIKYTQWFNVDGRLVEEGDKISTLKNEYVVNWRTMSAVANHICKQWITNPGVLVIDGEMYSSNKKAMPYAKNTLDSCYMISCIYQKLGLPETRKKYIIVLGDCPAIEGVTVIHCKNEIEVGDRLADLTNELDPSIISGYNILSFDNPYIDTRRKVTGMPWKPMGRLIGKNAFLKPLNWKSSGGGYNSINFMVRPGRIEVDFYTIAKRELKLPKYTLNDVAGSILKEQKHDVSAQDMFTIYENNLAATKAYNYYKNLDQTNEEILKRAEEHYIKQQEEFAKVAKYCVQDSELVIKLFDKWKAWLYLIELSKIQDINVEELFTGGQQKRVFSQTYDLATNRNFVVDRRDLAKVEWKGGFVFDPNAGLYDYVICLDFKSLYPSIIRAYNLCYTTLIALEMMDMKDQDGNEVFNSNNCHIIEWDEEVEEEEEDKADDLQDTKKTAKKAKVVKVVHFKYKFLKYDENNPRTHGLLPELVGRLIDGRNAVRGEQKGLMKEIEPLEARQKKYNKLQELLVKIRAEEKLSEAELAEYASLKSVNPLTKEEEAKLGSARLIMDVYREQHNELRYLIQKVRIDQPLTADEQVKYELVKTVINNLNVGEVAADVLEEKLDKLIKMIELNEDQTELNSVVGISEDDQKLLAGLKTLEGRKEQYEKLEILRSKLRLEKSLSPEEQEEYKVIKDVIPLTDEEDKKLNDLVTYHEILDKRQLGLKLTANSYFGALGVQDGGVLPLIEVARVITAKGRELILGCNKYIKDNYDGLIVYNDTDSTMFVLPTKYVKNGAECVDMGHKIEKEINTRFPKFLSTEFEKCGRMFAVKKKKYAFWQMYMFDHMSGIFKKGDLMPKVEGEGVLIKGMTLARRDNCAIQRAIFKEVLWNILDRKPIQETLDVIVKNIVNVYCHNINSNELVIIKGLGANYKSDSYYMKIFGDEIARIGKPAAPGERLSFLIVKTQNPNDLLGYKLRLPETYFERYADPSTREEIDYLYYIEKAIMNSIEQLWQIGYNKELEVKAKQYELEDKINACNYVYHREGRNQAKNQEKMMALYNYFQGDYNMIYETMFNVEGLKTASQEAKRYFISGKKVFHARMDIKPIKKMVKAMRHPTDSQPMMFELVSKLASPALALELTETLKKFYGLT